MKRRLSLWEFGFTVLFIVVGLLTYIGVQVGQNNQIDDWAAQHGYKVEQSERCVLNRGPYWYVDEDSAVYRVVISDHDHQRFVTYLHFGLFGLESSEPQRQ